MTDAEQIRVEVAYARPDTQVILTLKVEPGVTIQETIERSGILAQFPEIDLERNRVGVFGKLRKRTDTLADGDRVEIYRPLIADPKEVRRQRAAQGKSTRKGVGAR